MKKNNTDVMEVDVEEMLPESPLDKQIENALVKENITDKVIRQLKETFGGMTLKSVDDKESYLEIKKGRLEVRRIGILVEKVCKKGREDAVTIQKKWLNKEKEVLAKIAEVQDPLDAEIKKFEDEIERKENEEKQRREEAFMARQSSLLKYGAEYRNGSYELNELSYEVELIKNADAEMWDEVILPKYKRVYEQKEAARVAEETKRREEMERQEAERKELEEKQAAFRKEQEEFERQKRELQEQKDAADKEERLKQQEKHNEEIKKRQLVVSNRIKQLQQLGLNYSIQYDSYIFEDVAISRIVEIEGMDNEKWEELILTITPTVEKNKKELEEKRLAKIESDKQEAIAKALADQKEADEKRQRDIEEKKQQEEIQRQLELDAATDRTKYQDVVNYLSEYPVYEMKSGIYRKKMNIIKDFIADLKDR